MTVPTKTREQSMEALELANQIRRSRKELKRQLTNGERTVAEVLRANEDFIQGMRVGELLRAVPAIGWRKAARTLTAHKLGPDSRVSGLSASAREHLIAYLTEHFRRAPIDPEIEAEMYGGKGGYR